MRRRYTGNTPAMVPASGPRTASLSTPNSTCATAGEMIGTGDAVPSAESRMAPLPGEKGGRG